MASTVKCLWCGAAGRGLAWLARHAAAAGHLRQLDYQWPARWYECPCGFRGPLRGDADYYTMAEHWEFWGGVAHLTEHLLRAGLGIN